MYRAGQIIVVLAIVAVTAYFLLPLLISPSGTWTRRELRENPLVNPIQTTVDADGAIHLSDGRVLRLTGIRLPDDAALCQTAVSLIRACVRQGVVVEQITSPEHAVMRCEPRVFHWCGNDPVSAHYQQWILNELILAAGLARADPQAGTPEDSTMRRHRGAQRLAWRDGLEIWAQSGNTDEFDFDERWGLNISSVSRIRHMDDAIEDALTWRDLDGLPD